MPDQRPTDSTPAGPGLQRCRTLADSFRRGVTHPTVVASRTANVLASLDLEKAYGWRRRCEPSDPPIPWAVVMEGYGPDDEPVEP